MSYQIMLLPSKTTFDCNKGESILDSALRNNIDLPFGCQSGICGACSAEIINGEYTYPDGEPGGLTSTEKDANIALLCQAHPKSDLSIYVNIEEEALPAKIVPVKLIEKKPLTHDIIQLKLKLPEAESFNYHAGQYINFLLDDGKKRSFSLASPPNSENSIELQIRYIDDGYFTDIVFNKIKVGEILRIEGPLGSFYLRKTNNRPIIMIGGGTGFAPLKGMVEQIINDNQDLDIHLFWGVRAKRDLYMLDLIEQWKKDLPKFKFNAVLSEPGDNDNWQGEIGFVHEAVITYYKDLSDHDIYMCGPPIMIEASREAVIKQGLPLNNMFSDSFDFQE